MSQVKSPLTNTTNVISEDSLSTELIIEAYQKDYNIDVTDYFKEVDYVEIYKCVETGYKFYFPLHITGKSNLYEQLQQCTGYYQIRLEHKIAKTFLNVDNSVLEIGCGNGFFLENIQNLCRSCTGLEFNDGAIEDAKTKNLNVLAESIHEHAKNHFEKYDVVCSFQVLEHIVEAGDFIQATLDCLKVGGKLIIGVPNNNPYLYKHDKYHTLNLPPHHMGLWNLESLNNLQNIFAIQVNHILVEPLHQYEYDSYFKIQSQHPRQLVRLLSTILLKMRPIRIRRKIQNIVGGFLQGRNILAVYTKI